MDPLSNPEIWRHVEAILHDIALLEPRLRELADSLADTTGRPFDAHSADAWARRFFRYAVQRLAIFGHQNFIYIETLSLLALTRYLFELTVWIRLIAKDRRYGLVYYYQHLETMESYYKDQIEHLKREAELLKTFDQMESEQLELNLKPVMAEPDSHKQLAEARAFPGRVMSAIDAEAAKNFLVFADDAQKNGFGFQAYLIETKMIQAALGAVNRLEAGKLDFSRDVPQSTRDLIPKKWDWRRMAGEVGMMEQYDFIYRYTSKLLHATPVSITTDRPNLELFEVRTFLRYILVTLREVIQIVDAQRF